MDSTNLVNASIVMYISFTFLFFVLKFRFFPENNYIWIVAFLTISCIFQTIQNIGITTSPGVCGKADIKIALYSTLIPWILVFTLFTLCMMTMPGWLRAFSNTFGLFAAEAYGLKEIVNQVIRKPTVMSNDHNYLQMIDNIYMDRMALVVELNLEDVTDISGVFSFPALKKLEDLKIIPPSGPEDVPAMRELYSALLLKDNVGYFFWFLLMGIFCILVSTNTILASTCTPSVGSSYDSIFGDTKTA